jgi:hypothetical protein
MRRDHGLWPLYAAAAAVLAIALTSAGMGW